MLHHYPSSFPVAATNHTFVVGQDGEGHWLAVETHGLGGGLFASKAAAMHYALFEAEGRANAVVLAIEPLSLAFAAPSGYAAPDAPASTSPRLRSSASGDGSRPRKAR